MGKLIGLTGGIGSGKSTVANLLAERGAVVIDADEIAHGVYDPGTEGHEKVVARFGTDIFLPEGTYRVRATNPYFRQGDHDVTIETNVIEVRVGEIP